MKKTSELIFPAVRIHQKERCKSSWHIYLVGFIGLSLLKTSDQTNLSTNASEISFISFHLEGEYRVDEVPGCDQLCHPDTHRSNASLRLCLNFQKIKCITKLDLYPVKRNRKRSWFPLSLRKGCLNKLNPVDHRELPDSFQGGPEFKCLICIQVWAKVSHQSKMESS